MATDRQASCFADDATLTSARSGDRDAMGVLWSIYQPQLLRLLAANRAPSAEDVASRVWIDVGRAIHRFVGDGEAFRRWMFTIARRRTIDEARRVRRRGESSSENAGEVHSPDSDPRIDAMHSLDVVVGLMRQLPRASAEVVMMRVVHDMSVGDVASITGRSEGHVRVLNHRGLRQLRALIESSDAANAAQGANGDRDESGSDEVGDLVGELLNVPG